MSRTEELKLIISGDGKLLSSALKKSSADINSYTKHTESKLLSIGKRMGIGLGRKIASPFAALTGGAALLYAGKQIMDFDSKLFRLAIQGQMASHEQMQLRNEIIETGLAAGQSRNDVLAGLDAIVQRTGDIAFARDIMRDMAIASSATGAAMLDLGALASNLKQKLNLSSNEIVSAFNILTVQGKAGAFTLQDMAAQGERLFSSAGRFNMSGLEDVKKFGGLIQVAMMGAGSPEQATTAIESVISNIIEKQDLIRKKANFSIFSNSATKELKSIDNVIKGIIAGTKGDEKLLGQIFGESGIRAVSTLARSYRETGGFDLFEKLISSDRPGEVMRDFARYSQSASFQFSILKGVAEEFADSALSPVIADLSKRLQELTKDPAQMQAFRMEVKRIAETFSGILTTAVNLTAEINKIIPLLQVVSGTISLAGGLIQSPFKAIQSGGNYASQLASYRHMESLPASSRASIQLSNQAAMDQAARQAANSRIVGSTAKNDIALEINIDMGNMKVSSHSNNINTKVNPRVGNRGWNGAAQ